MINRNTKFYTIIALFIIVSMTVRAQENLPHFLTQDEIQKLPLNLTTPHRGINSITSPPTLPVRTAAEWEEVQALLITWTGFPSILSQIVDAAQEECEVIISCTDSNQVKNYLIQQNIPLTNVKYLITSFNSIWLRDYSAHTAYLNDVDSLIMVEWIYNRPRPDDDIMPVAQMNFMGIPLYSTTQAPNDLVNTGGNWMVDGFGTAFASKLILNENEAGNPYGVSAKTEAQIDTIVKKFQGINRYIKMEALPYDVIHHIDMHIKLLDEETLLVGEYPQGISDGPQIEANLQYVLSNFNSIFGTPYKVIRIPMPPSSSGANPGSPFGNASYRTYTNCVFINKTVIVPYYRQEYDTIAARILGNALPGYNIVGIDCDNSSSNIISQLGAIHCITNTVGAYNPLLISHQPLPNTGNSSTPYQVDAFIKHKSGIQQAAIYFTTDTSQGYQSVPMTLTNAANNNWTGYIPAQAAGSTVYYYIDAVSHSGKHQVRPITAPLGYWKFNVDITTAHIFGVENEFEIKDIYPNPGNAISCIPVYSNSSTSLNVAVYDMVGRKIDELFNGEIQAGSKNLFINCTSYDAGVYHIVFNTSQSQYTKKICINK
ncbi:MAG: agmatine deiminase family protein [Bacteroidia bacterium]|nr:agmatine deiminase family protein [Bacteroidia bacterium]MCZ2249654.1 agmatine deiminase family protein [Bacteroidia bacterium]